MFASHYDVLSMFKRRIESYDDENNLFNYTRDLAKFALRIYGIPNSVIQQEHTEFLDPDVSTAIFKHLQQENKDVVVGDCTYETFPPESYFDPYSETATAITDTIKNLMANIFDSYLEKLQAHQPKKRESYFNMSVGKNVALQVKDETAYARITDVTFHFDAHFTVDCIDAIALFKQLSARIKINNRIFRERVLLFFKEEQQIEIMKAISRNPRLDEIDWKLLYQLLNPNQFHFPSTDAPERITSDNNRMVTIRGSTENNYTTAVTKGIDPKTHHNLFFYCEIEVVSVNSSFNWSFGLGDGNFPSEDNMVGFEHDGSPSYGYSSDGILRCAEGGNQYSKTGQREWKDVDTRVGLLVSFIDNTITFFVNGEKEEVSQVEGGKMPLLNMLPVPYYYMLTMYSSGDSAKICTDLSINFLEYIYPLIAQLTKEGVVIASNTEEDVS
jgi:hypothetical protein